MRRMGLVLGVFGIMGLTGCSGDWNTFQQNQGGGDLSQTSPLKSPLTATGISVFNVNKYAANKLVCDPFQNASAGTLDLEGGLQASLHYLRAGQPRYHNVSDLIKNGTTSEKNLFFSNLNVPTRLFSAGFPLETGGRVKNDEGQDLVEYFALRFTGSLGLAPDQEEGDYELALLSDDGAILRELSDSETNAVLVNNDGDHPTRFGCGRIVHMTRTKRLSVQIDYYQGPRYHIAIVPMWRKVATGTVAGKDAACGVSGNETFFDYNNGSAPKKAYNDLLARGWVAMRAENWKLPQEAEYNPCYEDGLKPVISDLEVAVGSEGVITVSWRTNIPATSQVLFKSVSDGVENLSVSDNLLRVRHSVTLEYMNYGERYDIQAISISETLGRTISDPIRVVAQ